MDRATMPEAAVHEHRDLSASKGNIDAPTPVPGTGQWILYRIPAPWRRCLNYNSGLVSRPRLACIFRRTAGELAQDMAAEPPPDRRGELTGPWARRRSMHLVFSNEGAARSKMEACMTTGVTLVVVQWSSAPTAARMRSERDRQTRHTGRVPFRSDHPVVRPWA